jgi:hypothetical protein
MCDWRKLLRRVESRPEIEIADKRLAFFIQTPFIEPSYKTGHKTGKNVDFSNRTRFLFEKISRAACSSRRQACKTPLFGTVDPYISIRKFFKTGPRDFNLEHYRPRQWCLSEMKTEFIYCIFGCEKITDIATFSFR